MLESIGLIRQGEERFVDTAHTEDLKLPVGTTVVARNGALTNLLTGYISALTNGKTPHSVVPKSVYKSLPLERRHPYSPEEIEALASDSGLRQQEKLRISKKMTAERAVEIITAVLGAIDHVLHPENTLPQNPFRPTDNIEIACMVVQAADLLHLQGIPQIPIKELIDPNQELQEGGIAKINSIYRTNIRRAVGLLISQGLAKAA